MRRLVFALAFPFLAASAAPAATLVVTNLNDVAAGSLRQAVLEPEFRRPAVKG